MAHLSIINPPAAKALAPNVITRVECSFCPHPICDFWLQYGFCNGCCF
jgi:hypothetical protein